MINQLPDVSKITGIILYKERNPPEEWYIKLQYSDKDNNLQEINLSLRNGVRLLNLLREAVTDEHVVERWNRNKLSA